MGFTLAAARKAALVAALSVAGFARLAHAQPGDDPRGAPSVRAPRDAGFDVPWTTIEGAECALELTVSLDPLGANARSLAFIAVPYGTASSCDGGTVLWELPRALFDVQAPRPLARDARLRRRVGAPIIDCNSAYAVHTCVRDAGGRLHEGVYAGSAGQARRAAPMTTTSGRETIATPSGPARPRDLTRGSVVLALNPGTGELVETSVRRWLEQKTNSRPRAVVDLVLDDGRTLVLLADEQVWDAHAHVFRRAVDLTAGMTLLGPDARIPRVQSITPGRSPWGSATQFDVAWPDTLFANGVLVHDALTRGSPTPRTPPPRYAPMTPGSVTVQPVVQSWDCQLSVEVTVRALPPGTQSVAIVSATHTGPTGARTALACGAATINTELPRALLDAVRRDGGADALLELTLSGGAIRCDALVDVLACLRDPSGALTPAEPYARVGRSGPTCLAAGTMIDTPSGAVPVESLALGTTVLSRDPTTGRSSISIVERVQPIENRPMREILLDDGISLRATPEHLVWSATRRAFVRVDTLRVGERLLRRTGAFVRVREVQDHGVRDTVYDLSVTAPDTYFASGVLCHNY